MVFSVSGSSPGGSERLYGINYIAEQSLPNPHQGRRKGEKSGMAHPPRAELWDPRRGSPTAGVPGASPGKFFKFRLQILNSEHLPG